MNQLHVPPRNKQEQEKRVLLEQALRSTEFSAAIAWIISLGKRMEQDLDVIQEFTTSLLGQQGFSENPRETCGWSVLYYFTVKVSSNVIILGACRACLGRAQRVVLMSSYHIDSVNRIV